MHKLESLTIIVIFIITNIPLYYSKRYVIDDDDFSLLFIITMIICIPPDELLVPALYDWIVLQQSFCCWNHFFFVNVCFHWVKPYTRPLPWNFRVITQNFFSINICVKAMIRQNNGICLNTKYWLVSSYFINRYKSWIFHGYSIQ